MDLKRAHIFKTGSHPGQNANGLTFSEADLDGIVSAFNQLQQAGRVPIKFGHSDEQPLTDGKPALGWVKRIWREGVNLFGDFTDIPSVVFAMIRKALYKFCSIELLKDASIDGKSFPYVLDAVSLLGADPPAVSGLEDLQKLTLSRDAFTFGSVLAFKRALRFSPPKPIDDPSVKPTPSETDNQEQWMQKCMVSSYMNAQHPEQTDRAVACFVVWQNDGPIAHGGGTGGPKLSRATPKPYGDVEYADPKNGKYPIDTEEHIRAAWSYAHHPDNEGKYSAEEMAKIKAKIVAAWKAKIDKAGPPSAVKHARGEDAELVRLRAENARLESERATFARAQNEAAAKAHREALIGELEGAVRGAKITPAARAQFVKRLDDPAAALRFSREDVQLFIRSNDQSTLLRGLCGGVTAFARDPRSGALHGQVRFTLAETSAKMFARAKADNIDVFDALVAELRSDPDLAAQVWSDTFSPATE